MSATTSPAGETTGETAEAGGADGRWATAHEKAAILVEALPYIRRFRGQTVVIKYGGNAMTDPALAVQFAEDIVLLRSVGLNPVVVHGGGPQIGDLLHRLGIESEFRDGLRVTDAETLEIARMVLVGKVGRDIVSAINVHGALAVGLSGEDAGLITAGARDPELGFVGDVEAVNPAILERLIDEELVPVISTIGSDVAGQAYNINADTVAAAVAEALAAEKVIFLTDVPGLLRDVDDPSSIISRASVDEIRQLIADGVLSGGMIPKIEGALRAVERGVRSAHVLDGRVPHVVLLELFTDAGIGTMLYSPTTAPDHASGGPAAHSSPQTTASSAEGRESTPSTPSAVPPDQASGGPAANSSVASQPRTSEVTE